MTQSPAEKHSIDITIMQMDKLNVERQNVGVLEVVQWLRNIDWRQARNKDMSKLTQLVIPVTSSSVAQSSLEIAALSPPPSTFLMLGHAGDMCLCAACSRRYESASPTEAVMYFAAARVS